MLLGYQGAAPDDNFQNDPEDECLLQAPPTGTAAPFLGLPPAFDLQSGESWLA